MGWRDLIRPPSPEGRGSMTVSEHNRWANGEAPGRMAPTPLWRKLLVGEQRAVTTWDVWGEDGVGTKTNSGTNVNETTAFKFQVVYSAITLIADGVASLPPQAFTEGDDGSMEPAVLPQWIRKPHPEIRRFDIWNQLLVSVLAWGNGYAQFIRRPSDGVIVGLSVLDPADVTVEWDPNRNGFRRYRIQNGPWITSQEIFHIQGPTLPGREKGMSVIAQAREAIGLGLTLEEFGARYFGQGSQAKIVIELPGNQVPDESKAKSIVATFERFHRGRNNWHRPALVTGGAKLHNISVPPEDAQFLQSREFQSTTIAGWFRVPPHRVGLVSKSTSWGSGLAEENMAMLQHTFRPWILRLEGALTAYAPGGEDRGLIIKLGDDVLQRGTFKEAADTWSMLVEKGLATPDEGRLKLGLKPLGGEAAKLRDPMAQPGGDPADPRSKEDDRKRKQDEAAGRSRRDKDVLEAHYRADSRHLPGKHNQKDHGHGGKMVETGTTYDSLSPKGKAAVDAWYEEMGVTHEGMVAEIESKLKPEHIKDGQEWYEDARTFNSRTAEESGLTLAQVTAITAATSPLNPWPTNKDVTEKIAKKYRDYEDVVPTYRNQRGKLDTPDQARGRAMGGYLSQPMGIGFGIARLRGKDGGPPSDDEIHAFIDKNLTGTKRRSFYNNMLDPVNSRDITVDTWMNRVAMYSSTKPKVHAIDVWNPSTKKFETKMGGVSLADAKTALGRSEKSTGGAGAGYVGISDAVRAVAKKTGLHPHEVQAAYWIAVSGSKVGATGT